MNTFKVNTALFFSIFFWASAFVGIRIGLEGYSPGSLALLRFLVASFCMFLMNSSMRQKSTICWKDRFLIALLGLVGIGVYNVCLNYGEVTVSAGIASFLIGLMPVVTVVLSLFIFKERLARIMWVGIAVSFLGLLLIILDEAAGLGSVYGVFAILISAVSGAILNIYQKYYIKKYHTVEITAWVMWGGTCSLLIFAPNLYSEIQIASWKATLAVVYMGVFPAALAYVAWGYALKYLTASQAAIALYAMPIISTVLGLFILGEIPTWLSLVGGLIALIGAVIASRSKIK